MVLDQGAAVNQVVALTQQLADCTAELRTMYAELARRDTELSAISAIGQIVAATHDQTMLIGAVGDQILALFGAARTFIGLYDPTSGQITFPYDRWNGAVVHGDLPPPGEGLITLVIADRQVLRFNDRREFAGLTHERSPMIESWLGAPIVADDAVIGLIGIASVLPHAYVERDEVLLMMIASVLGIGLYTTQLTAEVMASHAAVAQASVTKSRFLATMSHELRTPLNTILGFTRIVRRKAVGVLPEKQVENLDKVLGSSEHLLDLINTILDIAKIDVGRMHVQLTSCDPTALISTCTTMVQPLLRPGVTLTSRIDRLPIISIDQEKLRQIVISLLSNAAKFTHQGQIVVCAAALDAQLVVTVEDSGIGIAPEALEQIFTEFHQADSSTTRQYGGTGLGLSLSRRLARLLSGDLTVASTPDVGATFTLSLPLIRAGAGEPSPNPHAVPPDAHGRRLVLVIDDDPDVHDLLGQVLRETGYAVVGATSGDEGLRLARRLRPSAITLDIMMPTRDGWQVLHDLKADPATCNIPVIVVSIIDNQPLGIQLGAVAYLRKPLDSANLLDTLAHVTLSSAGPRRLLVADDDPHIAELLGERLGEHGYELTVVPDGAAALAALEAAPYDALLLDLMMPVLDGFGVLAQLSARPGGPGLPVVVLTAHDLSAAERTLLSHQTTQVLMKHGFDTTALLRTLALALESPDTPRAADL